MTNLPTRTYLFYARGVQTVGMDDVRDASGVSLKRLYQLFPSSPGTGTRH